MSSSKKRKKFVRIFFAVSLVVFVFISGYFFYQWLLYRKARFVKYPEFGIAIPEQYSIHGIDVSKYQSVIAWDEVSAMQVKKVKIGFAFIKATEGISKIDPQFKRNWKKAKEAGIIRGAYHFFLATKDGRAQAGNFLKTVSVEANDLPPVLDIEQSYGVSKQILQKEVKEWLQVVEENCGVKPIIYTNLDFYSQWLGEEFDSYPLWVAHYYQPHQPRIKRDWYFWQHNDNGRVNGIVSPVDFNVFSGDSIIFRQLLVK